MTNARDTWDELAEVTRLLAEFNDGSAEEYFGVELMRVSLERRRSNLLDELLTHDVVATERLDVELDHGSAGPVGADLRGLSALLGEVQESVAAIATGIVRGRRRVRISPLARELASLRLSMALPGSLTLRLVPADAGLAAPRVDVFGEHPSVVEESIAGLLHFVARAASNDPESALELLAELGASSALHLRTLTRVVAEIGTAAEFRWRSPRGDIRAKVTPEAAQMIYEYLGSVSQEETEVVHSGRLVGGSLVRRRFELELDDGRVLAGTVEDEALLGVEKFFGQVCTATIVELRLLAAGGRSRLSRTLVALEPITP
jgi:hypothetical protein